MNREKPQKNIDPAQEIYPHPLEIVETSLSKIEPNGSVNFFDDMENRWVPFRPYESISLTDLPPDVFSVHLIRVARDISHTCNRIGAHRIGDQFVDPDWEYRCLAHTLTAYRHDHRFLEIAASLRKQNERGFWNEPILPTGSPWDWVPQLLA